MIKAAPGTGNPFAHPVALFPVVSDLPLPTRYGRSLLYRPVHMKLPAHRVELAGAPPVNSEMN
ncbi:MAG: hypothetical protein JW743_06765 [Deltaproteobacteria bacterium]|nr:hypothetical protein [Deltaproteobacteria bacterium]MBN2846160.1 hypothetical protein [Deltaproteobacteria bacterium]